MSDFVNLFVTVEMDNLGTNYIRVYIYIYIYIYILHYITLSFIMPGLVNLNANFGVKAISFVEVDNL